jgi:DNA-binding SARP family transcriptional activator
MGRALMGLSIYLLGRPWAERDGTSLPQPRGRKAWALLAYLTLTARPVARESLASLLFSEADDPLGAVRWSLTELRRLLGEAESLKGDRLALSLPPGTYVDVRALTSGSWLEASAVPGLGQELLGGMDFPSSPGFEAWLLNERRRMTASSTAALREAALIRLSRGDPEGACDLASRLVALEPLEENHQALLIRSYMAAGDEGAAARQLAGCVELFRRELGTDPGPAVTSAMRSTPPAWRAAPPSGAATGRAQLDAGLAALRAGVLDAAVVCLSRAASEADTAGDPQLKATAMFELGSALVHSGRNRYEEGAAVLFEVLPLAERLEDPLLQAAAARELAWVELLAARYERCEAWLERALVLASGDPGETARALWMSGMALTEVGRYGESMRRLRRAIELADDIGDARAAGLARALLGKAHVMRRELAEGRECLERSLGSFRSAGWTWLLPWPEAYLGELELFAGNLDEAEGFLEHAFALAHEISDPCFLAKSEANLGLLQAARGATEAAVERLESARMWLVKTPDHTWTLGYALDAACMVGTTHGLPEAAGWINDLEVLAGRTGMREFVARAYVHRHNLLGRASDLEAAAGLADDVDNPHLQELVRTPHLATV